ncbi:Mixed-linked glucan synthase [Quillaja saponaria]|uniref:Mixed-linked glucan synthase n=1 Tax=Quillaja saponaria TaxID=32244 RepID=A0AAD7LYC0_QUISA|nr:Mixed-linked glucan synthase [Quillaja saponaria]
MATTTSSSCSGFFNLRSNSSDYRGRSSSSHGSPGCGKLDGVAMWFINGVTTAFFASLERCSCIGIATTEDVDGGEANDFPLILNDGNLRRHDGRTSSRRRTGKAKKSAGAFLQN